MKLDLNEQELAILSCAMFNYIQHVESIEAEFLKIENDRIRTENCGCCVSGDPADYKPRKPPYYKNVAFATCLREKIKMAQMMLPCEEQPERFNTRSYANYISGKERMK